MFIYECNSRIITIYGPFVLNCYTQFLGYLLNDLFNNKIKDNEEFLIMKISKVVCPLIHYEHLKVKQFSGMPSYLIYIYSN